MIRIAAVVVCILFASTVSAQPRVQKNVIYGMYSGLALLMDVHIPDTPNGHGVVLIPGSGFHLTQGLSSRVQAVVANAANTDLRFDLENLNNRSTVTSFMGMPLQPAGRVDAVAGRLYSEASPVTHVSRASAPLLLIHGDADETVAFRMLRRWSKLRTKWERRSGS